MKFHKFFAKTGKSSGFGFRNPSAQFRNPKKVTFFRQIAQKGAAESGGPVRERATGIWERRSSKTPKNQGKNRPKSTQKPPKIAIFQKQAKFAWRQKNRVQKISPGESQKSKRNEQKQGQNRVSSENRPILRPYFARTDGDSSKMDTFPLPRSKSTKSPKSGVKWRIP